MAKNFYLSFIHKEEKKDIYLGGCIINAPHYAEALNISRSLKINPGGSVMIIELPEDKTPSNAYHNKLLSFQEINQILTNPN